MLKLDDEGERELTLMRWGLIPFFSKDDKTGFKSTSARAETIATVPTFREAFKRRHCILPPDWFADWFYECRVTLAHDGQLYYVRGEATECILGP